MAKKSALVTMLITLNITSVHFKFSCQYRATLRVILMGVALLLARIKA